MTCWWNDLGKVASSKTEAGERSDRLELLSRPGGQDHHHQEDFQGGENSLLLAVGISKYAFQGLWTLEQAVALVKFFSSLGDRGNIKRGRTAASWWPKVAWGDTRGFLKKMERSSRRVMSSSCVIWCHVMILSFEKVILPPSVLEVQYDHHVTWKRSSLGWCWCAGRSSYAKRDYSKIKV